MIVFEIGRLKRAHDDDGLPEHGIIIEATADELKRIPANLLYNEVDVTRVDVVEDHENGGPQ